MTSKTYVVAKEGFFYGKFYKKLARITLNDRQAKYELMLGNIRAEEPIVSGPAEPAEAPAPAPVFTGRVRRGRRVSERT